ncbi:phosphotransferase enzyme family protein [Occultella kanbiaonis]|uniref:phosphotransferase enzyme family protein n=1 Tax=Occultella kanbiaonis TaxID=2675754 RepID=UPI0013D2F684|nr:phosphotransferase [Occultella kanbiaonis]
MTDLGVAAILAEYGLRATGPAVPLTGGEDNRNLRVAPDGPEVVLRAYRFSGPEKIRAELRLVAFLAEHGYPTSAPLRTRGGEVLVMAGSPVALFPLVPGAIPEAVTVPLAERVGELLAGLHLLTAGWADARIPTIDCRGVIDRALASRPDLDRDDRRLPRDLADAVVAGYDRNRALTAAERRLLPVALDLVGIVDAAGVLMWAAPELGLRRVDECRSWVAYLRNAGTRL